MADAPAHVVSCPSQDYQPYDATTPGTADTAPQGGNPYEGNGLGGPVGGWVKIKDAGAASMSNGTITGGWPGNGASSDGGWEQC